MDHLIQQHEILERITLADLFDRCIGKMAKLCLGDNNYIQGIIDEVQEDYILVRREPPTIVPLDKILWLQFIE
jgi:hypothetical protein